MGTEGWHSRGYLPHFDSPEKIQSITFRLGDSLPIHAMEQVTANLDKLAEGQRKAELFRRLEAWLDNGQGECHLRRPEIAAIVEELLISGDAKDYRLIEWTIMPNHVHVLAEIAPSVPMSSVIKKWKGSSGNACNRTLGRTGMFWFPDYYDRFVRNEEHFINAVAYVRENPVKAGLCQRAADWPYGSARFCDLPEAE